MLNAYSFYYLQVKLQQKIKLKKTVILSTSEKYMLSFMIRYLFWPEVYCVLLMFSNMQERCWKGGLENLKIDYQQGVEGIEKGID